jgi:hypothetical protein
MRRTIAWLLVAFLSASVAVAQAAGGQDPAHHPPAGHDQAQHHPPGPGGDHHPMGGMQDHEKMMKEMQASMDGMKANLQKMKDGLATVKDQATHDQLQININLWQSLIENMDHHMHMMGAMMEHGGMQHGKGMEHHGGPGMKPKTPEKTPETKK